VTGFRLLLVAYGAVATLEVVITGSVLDALNAVGAVGLAGVALGATVYLADRSLKEPAARAQHLRSTLGAIAVGTTIVGLAVLLDPPFDDGEHAFNLLTFAGGAILLFYAFMASVGAQRLLR
jgi:hypothetical protein